MVNIGFVIEFGRLMMKPGKPTTFARGSGKWSGRVCFGLPGNPCSAWVTGKLLVMEGIRRMAGLRGEGLEKVEAMVEDDIMLDHGRPEYHRVVLEYRSELRCFTAKSTGVQRSSRLTSTMLGGGRNANGLLMCPKGTEVKGGRIRKGEVLDCLVVGELGGGGVEGEEGEERVKEGGGEGRKQEGRFGGGRLIFEGCDEGNEKRVREGFRKGWMGRAGERLKVNVLNIAIVNGGGWRDECARVREREVGGRNVEKMIGMLVGKHFGGKEGSLTEVAVGKGEKGVEVVIDFGGSDVLGIENGAFWREVWVLLDRVIKMVK